MITLSLDNSSRLLKDNNEYVDMINLLESCINEEKYNIQSKEDKIEKEEFTNKDNLTISKKITKVEDSYMLYKVAIEIKSDDRSVKLNSYVTKK